MILFPNDPCSPTYLPSPRNSEFKLRGKKSLSDAVRWSSHFFFPPLPVDDRAQAHAFVWVKKKPDCKSSDFMIQEVTSTVDLQMPFTMHHEKTTLLLSSELGYDHMYHSIRLSLGCCLPNQYIRRCCQFFICMGSYQENKYWNHTST